MRTLRGKPIAPGFAEGRAVVYRPSAPPAVVHRTIRPEDLDAEAERLAGAVARAVRQLERIERRVRGEIGDSQAAIFSAHVALLSDPKFQARIRERMRCDLIGVEQAVGAEVEAVVSRLSGIDDDYLRERSADVRDVGRRLLRELLVRRAGAFPRLAPGSVLIAPELLPSDTIDLDRRNVAAVVTEHGGENGHAAILARSLGVPAVSGIEAAVEVIAAGTLLQVDGERGEVTLAPSTEAARGFRSRKRAWDTGESRAISAEGEACVTLDGARIGLYANVARPEEAGQPIAHHLDGIGLFRTEFLFLEAVEPPSFERQVEVYRAAAEALGGLPMVVRTLDLGGDKIPAFLEPSFEVNPNLGMRGLRFSLAERQLFRTQLRAIATVAAEHDVRILLPMVLGVADLRAAIEAADAAAGEVASRRPPIGAMIETPAALFALDEILGMVDFASIGTNDLCQYMLAADRSALDMVEDESVLHPAVLRALRRIIDAARAARRPVSLCGEAAGDPRIAALLIGLGLRDLSMSTSRAARVRYALRRVRAADMEALARDALACENAADIERLLASAVPIV